MKWQEIINKLKYSLQRFFYGRNGTDQLSIALLFFSIILSIIAQLFDVKWLFFFYYVGAILSFYRILSKDVYKRRKENQWFLLKTKGLSKGAKLYQRMYQDRHSHRYLKCPNCKQQLRVPKGKGKIEITCSKCKQAFIKNV